MSFPTSRILNVSLRDYLGKTPREQYDLQGVHLETSHTSGYPEKNIMEEFAKQVPERAEVVVDFRENVVGAGWGGEPGSSSFFLYSAHGTALIPKEQLRRR